MSGNINETARHTVELLGEERMTRYIGRFREIITGCHRLAGDSDELFVENVVCGIEPLIHYASTRPRLIDTLDWIIERHPSPRADALAVLLMLTLVDVVNRICDNDDAEWNAICQRVGRLKRADVSFV